MKREKYILIACLFLISSFALLAQEERFITVETEPANCTVKIYEWVPREGNKGDLIAEGESPLKISEATLKEAHGVIITAEAKKEGYRREERTLFPPYKFSFNTLEIQIGKDYEYLARKAEQERKSEAERYRTEEAERRREEGVMTDISHESNIPEGIDQILLQYAKKSGVKEIYSYNKASSIMWGSGQTIDFPYALALDCEFYTQGGFLRRSNIMAVYYGPSEGSRDRIIVGCFEFTYYGGRPYIESLFVTGTREAITLSGTVVEQYKHPTQWNQRDIERATGEFIRSGRSSMTFP